MTLAPVIRPPQPPHVPYSQTRGRLTGTEADCPTSRHYHPAPRSQLSLWLSSFGLVSGVLVTTTLAWVYYPERTRPSPAASAPLVIDIAMLAAPESDPDQAPSPIESTSAKPAQPEPEAKAMEVPLPKAKVADQQLQPKRKSPEETTPQEALEPVEEPPLTEKEESVAMDRNTPETPQRAESAAAPQSGLAATLVQANRAPQWRDSLVHALNTAKRYPNRSRRLRQEGMSYLYFKMNREGKVLDAHIHRSSSYSLLDKETLALLKRASPLPKPPESAQGETFEFIVPVEFKLASP